MQMLTQCTMHLLKNREQSGQDFLCHFLVGTEETKSQQNHRFVWLWFWFQKVGIGSEPSQVPRPSRVEGRENEGHIACE